MQYSILPTGACTNDCMICCMRGELRFGFYHVGKTEEEKKGLENLLKSIEEPITLSGGDPLRNETFLELFFKYHEGRKSILFNPLTFLCLELNKPASKISDKDATNLIDKVKKEGLSQKTQKLIHYLSKFDLIGKSKGNLQGPNPEITKWSRLFYKEYIFPEIIKGVMERTNNLEDGYFKTEDNSLNGRFEGGYLVEAVMRDYDKVACVGKLRKSIEDGKAKIKMSVKATGREEKDNMCTSPKNLNLYFKKEDDQVYLFLTLCCSTAGNPYVSFKTNLTLEKMAKMTPNQVKKTLREEVKKRNETKLYRLFQEPWYILPRFIRIQRDKEEIGTSYESAFVDYLHVAEELLKERTGKNISVLENTYTLRGGESAFCEGCNTVGILLHRAGVSVEEWQNYLDKKFS